MILLKMIFLFLAVLLCSVLIFALRNILTIKHNIKKYIVIPFCLGIFAIVDYSFFLLSDTYKYAQIFLTIFFCCMDWLSFSMLMFTTVFVGVKLYRILKGILSTICIIDSTSLVINIFMHHSFDMELLYFGRKFIQYWGITMNPFHWVHLSFCYLMVATSFTLMIIATIKSPYFYKRKYSNVLIAYAVLIVVDAFCILMNTPVDFSLLMYVVLAGFICYYTLYAFPHHLINFLLENVNDTINDGIVFFDTKGKYFYSNKIGTYLMTSSNKNALISIAAERYLHSWKSIYPEDKSSGTDTFTLDDNEHHFFVEYQTLVNDEIKIGSFFKFVDKTDEINQFKMEKYDATHDELTGIYNRAGFFEEVENVLKTSDKEHIMLASNIKDFKLINEIFGEEKGNLILIMQANLLKINAHSETIFGRISDDKFALFLRKDYFDKKVFTDNIDKISKVIDGSLFRFQIKIGIYESRFASEDPKLMYDKALLAMEQVPDDYQHVFAIYDSEFMDKMLEEKSVINEFESALSNREFCIYLQPQVKNDGSHFGAEALARWNHPKKGLVMPNKFIGVLEKTSMIHKLDQFVWEEAAKKLKEWKEKGIERNISVNVSPKDIYYIDICKTFIDIVNKYEINPKNLNIEFTETVFMEDFSKAKEILETLQSYGFKIEIDDFGSGYSSLNMLKDIKADVLKIDRAFLKESDDKYRSYEILRSIISMAKSLKMEVMTEGVETTEHIKKMDALGCDTFQGFYFATPVSVEEFEKQYL